MAGGSAKPMKKRVILYWLVPIMILAFVGTAVSFLNPIFNLTTRWLVLGIVVIYLFLIGEYKHLFHSRFCQVTILFAAWCLCTVIWSEQPMLSFMKIGAFILIVFTCMSAGKLWVRYNPLEHGLIYLVPLLFVTLVAGILGRYFASSNVNFSAVLLYQGMVGGSNMFGSMLAMCAPLLIWQTYLQRKNSLWCLIWLLLSGISVNYLLATFSRSSILVVVSSLLGFVLSLGVNRKLQISLALLGVFLIGFMVFPGQLEKLQQRYIYKNIPVQYGLLYTREDVWQESFRHAKMGGWIGGGYGVTIGDSGFEGGLTSVGYGREKGNTQLAIIEETGLIGFGIYLFSIIVLFKGLISELLNLPRGHKRIILSIVTGTLIGMILQSVFEAWWNAPGSPESLYFWTLTGVAIGIVEESKRLRLQRAVRQPINDISGAFVQENPNQG